MPVTAIHGSGCCGARCIQGFGVVTVDQLDQLDNSIRSCKGRRQKGFIEVIITDKQAVHWHKELTERGFERTHRFYNSGNSTCNVYIYLTGQENLIGNNTDPIPALEKAAQKIEPKKEVSSPFAKQAPEPPRPVRQGRAVLNPPNMNASPRAIRTANERGVSLANIQGTGPNGRILVRDVPNG